MTVRLRLYGFIFLAACLGPTALITPRGSEAAGTTGADFLTTEVSAIPAALAAGAAGLGGAECLTYNPAGISGQAYPGVSFTHFASFGDTAYEQLEGLYPGWMESAWALRVLYVNTYDFIEINEYGQELGTLTNYDLLVHAAWARSLGKNLTMGAAGKIFESALAAYRSRGAAVDLGACWQAAGLPVSLGVSLQNLGARTAFDREADPLPLRIRGGAEAGTDVWPGHELRVLADFIQPLAGDETANLAAGAEYNWNHTVFIRGGYRFWNELGSLSLGAGLRYGGLGLDYAYQPYLELGSNHRLTLNYIFLPPSAMAPEPALLPEPKPAALIALPRLYEAKVVFLPPHSGQAQGPWELQVKNGRDQVVRVFSGEQQIPSEIAWDGRDGQGQALPADERFSFDFQVNGRWCGAHELPALLPPLKLRFMEAAEIEPEVRFRFDARPAVQSCALTVWDANGTEKQTQQTWEKALPLEWVWDGKTTAGNLASSLLTYRWSLDVEYADQFKARISDTIQPVLAQAEPGENGRQGIRIPGVLFDFNRAELKPDMTDKILAATEVVRRYPGQASAICEGHADEIGGAAYNVKLSETRAGMVTAFMKKQPGLEKENLGIIGYGQAKPENTLGTEEGRTRNRRVEIRLLLPAKGLVQNQ